MELIEGKVVTLNTSEWIAAGDRLPDKFISVVVRGVFVADGGVYIGQYCGRGWMMQDGRAWVQCWPPSHWMPIPTPPTELAQ